MHGLARVSIDAKQVAAYCQKWGISRLSLFGSVLRDDFGPESDVDVLVEFQPGSGFTLENSAAMIDELGEIFGQPAHIVEARLLRNPFRAQAILSTAKVVYAS